MRNAEAGVRNQTINPMNDLKQRTKIYALDIVKFVEGLPRNGTTAVFGKQLLRYGTSVAANYRAACRGRSPAEFQAKMGIVEEEADESVLWLELLIESGHADPNHANPLRQEADELTAIAVSSIRTSRGSQPKK